MIRQGCDIEARVEAHRIDFRRHPMIEVSHSSQVAEKTFRQQKIFECKIAGNDFLPGDLDPLDVRCSSEFHRITLLFDAKKQPDFFEYFAKSRNPVTDRLLGFVPAV